MLFLKINPAALLLYLTFSFRHQCVVIVISPVDNQQATNIYLIISFLYLVDVEK